MPLVGFLNPEHSSGIGSLLKSLQITPLSIPSISHWDLDSYILSTLRRRHCSVFPKSPLKRWGTCIWRLMLPNTSCQTEKYRPWIYRPAHTWLVGRQWLAHLSANKWFILPVKVSAPFRSSFQSLNLLSSLLLPYPTHTNEFSWLHNGTICIKWAGIYAPRDRKCPQRTLNKLILASLLPSLR